MLATRIAAIVSAAGLCVGACCPSAHGQLRIGQWNITSLDANDIAPTTGPRRDAFMTAIYGVAPNSLQFAPDVLIVQEISKTSMGGNLTAVNAFRDMLNAAPGSPGDWAAATFVISQGDSSNAMFYRMSKVSFIDVATLGTTGGATPDVGSGDGVPVGEAIQSPRDNQRWRVRVAGYSGAGAELYMYGSHMKAQGGNNSAGRREVEGARLRTDANNLPEGIGGFLLAGDFNITDSDDLAYQYLVNYNAAAAAPMNAAAGQFFDPINKPSTGAGSWNNSCAFRNIHTQEGTPAPNSSSSPPSGGMDDRFDQILVSASLRDMQGLSYIPLDKTGNPLSRILTPFINPSGSCTAGGTTSDWNDPNHSYRCWGNDGNHINIGLIDNPNLVDGMGQTIDVNTHVGTSIARALITSFSGNGHLPVYLDMQVPAKLGAPAANSTIDFGTVNLNAAANMTLNITNAGNVALFSKDGTGWGVDGLTYTLSTSSGFTAPGGTFERSATAAPAQVNAHTISMSTSTLGPKTGTLTITSDDPDAPTRVINLIGTVASPNVICCKGTTCTTAASAALCTAPSGGVVGLVITACDPVHRSYQGCCYADFDHSGGRTIDDLFIYINTWLAGSSYTKIDGDGTGAPTIDDLFTFINVWLAHCVSP